MPSLEVRNYQSQKYGILMWLLLVMSFILYLTWSSSLYGMTVIAALYGGLLFYKIARGN